MFDNHHPDAPSHHLGVEDDTAFHDVDHLTGHHPGEITDGDSMHGQITDEDEDPYSTHHTNLHHAGHLDETHGGTHTEPTIVHHYPASDTAGNGLTHPSGAHHAPIGDAHQTDAHQVADGHYAAENVDSFVHAPGNMNHLVLPNHQTTPQPVLAQQPLVDTVAHHPVNPFVTNEKFDFPLRNPSPTVPIMLKGDNMVAQEVVGSSVARNFKDAYINYKMSHHPNYLTSSRIIYGNKGRRSGIAK